MITKDIHKIFLKKKDLVWVKRLIIVRMDSFKIQVQALIKLLKIFRKLNMVDIWVES